MTDMNMMEKMKEKAGLVQAVVSEAGNIDDVIDYAVKLTLSQNGKSIAANGLNAESTNRLKELCIASDIKFIDPPYRNHLEGIHTALTSADWAIAETGTLVLDASSEDLRIATMLSETHVAWIPASRIKPDAESIASYLREKMLVFPSYMSFITGPSRTADIERVLAIGVHGPQELHILLLKENPS